MEEIIDDFERMDMELEEGVKSCFNCEHSKVASNQEPCAGCRNRSNWKEGKAK